MQQIISPSIWYKREWHNYTSYNINVAHTRNLMAFSHDQHLDVLLNSSLAISIFHSHVDENIYIPRVHLNQILIYANTFGREYWSHAETITKSHPTPMVWLYIHIASLILPWYQCCWGIHLTRRIWPAMPSTTLTRAHPRCGHLSRSHHLRPRHRTTTTRACRRWVPST